MYCSSRASPTSTPARATLPAASTTSAVRRHALWVALGLTLRRQAAATRPRPSRSCGSMQGLPPPLPRPLLCPPPPPPPPPLLLQQMPRRRHHRWVAQCGRRLCGGGVPCRCAGAARSNRLCVQSGHWVRGRVVLMRAKRRPGWRGHDNSVGAAVREHAAVLALGATPLPPERRDLRQLAQVRPRSCRVVARAGAPCGAGGECAADTDSRACGTQTFHQSVEQMSKLFRVSLRVVNFDWHKVG
jgi:hypothetical protein